MLHVSQREATFTRTFGKAQSEQAMFLLGSISKPICMTALMTLFDRGEFKLERSAPKVPPYVRRRWARSGDDAALADARIRTSRSIARKRCTAKETRPALGVCRTRHPHAAQFAPGSRYQYSSMAILLAARVAELISGTDILTLVDRAVFQPLNMQHSARGLVASCWPTWSRCKPTAPPESGGGDPKRQGLGLE